MSQPKVLIIGPRFHYFNQSIERAFSTLGYQTRVLAYDNPVHPYTFANKVKYKLSGDKLMLKRRSRTAFSVEADRVFDEYSPDLVFIMNGDMLLHDSIRRWRGISSGRPVGHPAKVALWFFDSFTHIPLCEDNIRVVDAVFCYEQTDLPLIRRQYGVEAHFLPQAVDPELYHPLPKAETDEPLFDLVFAGDIFHSLRRREIIQAVVAHYPQLRIRVWGEYKPWYKNPLKWLLRERRDVYQNRNTTAEQLNHDYNHSRIVLNIHIEQQQDGANPKVYEISASDAYQICNANPYLEQLFPNGEVALYHNVDELFALIDEALHSDKRPQANAAHHIVVAHHTFAHRIRQVLEVLNVSTQATQDSTQAINF